MRFWVIGEKIKHHWVVGEMHHWIVGETRPWIIKEMRPLIVGETRLWIVGETRLWTVGEMRLWIVRETRLWIIRETRLWTVNRHSSELLGRCYSELMGRRNSKLFKRRSPWLSERCALPFVEGTQPSTCWRGRGLWFVKEHELQNAALKALLAVVEVRFWWRDFLCVKILLDLSRQNQRWRLGTRVRIENPSVVGIFRDKYPRVLLILDLRFALRIKAINWPIRITFYFYVVN